MDCTSDKVIRKHHRSLFVEVSSVFFIFFGWSSPLRTDCVLQTVYCFSEYEEVSRELANIRTAFDISFRLLGELHDESTI